MKKLFFISIAIITVLSSATYGGERVTKVSPEKIQNMTPEQRERFNQAGRDAQRAAEESIKDYKEVEEGATEGKEVSEDIRDTAVQILKDATGTN